MRSIALCALVAAFPFFPLSLAAQAPTYELRLGAGLVGPGSVSAVPLTLSAPASEIQGLVAVFEWDGTRGAGVDLDIGSAIADADIVTMRVEPNFMALGVVMSVPGSDAQENEVIEPGSNHDIATAEIRCLVGSGRFPVTLVDGAHAMIGDEPKLNNVVVEGGFSIGAGEGLALVNGSFGCGAIQNTFRIESGANNPPSEPRCGNVRVLMTNAPAVEGYVTAICHDAAVLMLESILPGAAATANGADFTAPEIFPAGGTLAVVMDLVPPFAGNTIPPGSNQHIATYRYCCLAPPARGQPPQITPLTFCDRVLGSPVKENVLVAGGESISQAEGLLLVNGTFTCRPLQEPPPPPPGEHMFACGSLEQDEAGMPGELEGFAGSTIDVCFFVKNPPDPTGPPDRRMDELQGFSMALTFCCDLTADDNFDISGTILEAIGAEFVTADADNDPTDGDLCELIIGVLVDALPPFDGRTIPALEEFQRMGCVRFTIREGLPCGFCCPIRFTDGVNGTGIVPVRNLVSIDNQSFSPQLMDCMVCIVERERFFRGDCNFSRQGMGMAVDIADAAAIVSFLFLPGTWKFNAPCLDACDCNDDGRIDLADVICVLQYYLRNGDFPPPPGPGLEITNDPNPNMVRATPPGPDPTDDKLDCAAGSVDCR